MSTLTAPAQVAPAQPTTTSDETYLKNVIAMQPRPGSGPIKERRAFERPAPVPRRRGSLQQGRALETLGHAVEYLVDSRMFLVEQQSPRADQDAVELLKRMSRAVFSECPEVVSVWKRVGKLCRASLERRTPAR